MVELVWYSHPTFSTLYRSIPRFLFEFCFTVVFEPIFSAWVSSGWHTFIWTFHFSIVYFANACVLYDIPACQFATVPIRVTHVYLNIQCIFVHLHSKKYENLSIESVDFGVFATSILTTKTPVHPVIKTIVLSRCKNTKFYR